MTAIAPSRPEPRGPLTLLLPAGAVYTLTLAVPMVLLVATSLHGSGAVAGALTFANYAHLVGDPYYAGVLTATLRLAVTVTIICIGLGWPVAASLAQISRRWRLLMTLVIIAPLLISVVVRSFGWVVLLGPGGLIAQLMDLLGVAGGGQGLLYSEAAVVIGMVHVLLPMMILSIAAAMNGIDPAVIRAAINLGASPLGALARIVVPLSMPGVLAGSAIVFSLSATSLITPMILGGATRKYMSSLIYQNTMVTLNFPMGGALSVMLLAAVLICVAVLTLVVERVLLPGVFRAQARS